METGTQPPRPSKIGLASLVIWLVSLLLTLILFAITFLSYMTNSTPPLSVEQNSVLLTVLAGGSCLLLPVALILGLIGTFQKGTRKTPAVIAAIGAGTTVLCIIVPLVLWAFLITQM